MENKKKDVKHEDLPSLIKFTYKDGDLKRRKLKRGIHGSECLEYLVWENRCRYWDLLTTEWYFFKKLEPTEEDMKHIISRISSAIEKLEMLPTTNHLYFFVHYRSTNNKSDWTFKTQQYLHRDAIRLLKVEKILESSLYDFALSILNSIKILHDNNVYHGYINVKSIWIIEKKKTPSEIKKTRNSDPKQLFYLMDAIFVHEMLNIIDERENNKAFDATTIKEKQAKDIKDFGDLLEQTSKCKTGSSKFTDFIDKCKDGALIEDLILHTYFERSTKTISKLLHKGYYGFKKLGTGTYGTDNENIHADVILASSKTDGQEYAVKYLSLNSDLEKAKKEIKRETYLSTLNHPNIVRYFHSWTENFNKEDSDEDNSDSNDDTTNRRIYIQMEYCECGTVRELINSKRFIGNTDLLWCIFRGILNGLVYIHRRKIVHKDLKPENIFFDRSLSAKIGDFGCATVQLRPEREDMENLGPLNSSTAAGSKPYAPLDTPIDTPFDIYSMGVILFELFLPLANSQISEAIENIQNSFPGNFANWAQNLKPTDLKTVIKRMLSISPGNRPTAEKLLEITPPVKSQKMFKITYEK